MDANAAATLNQKLQLILNEQRRHSDALEKIAAALEPLAAVQQLRS